MRTEERGPPGKPQQGQVVQGKQANTLAKTHLSMNTLLKNTFTTGVKPTLVLMSITSNMTLKTSAVNICHIQFHFYTWAYGRLMLVHLQLYINGDNAHTEEEDRWV